MGKNDLLPVTISISSDVTLVYFPFCIEGTFSEFTSDAFEPQIYANSVIEARKIGEALAKLSFGIGLLNKELHEQVGRQFIPC